MAAFSQPTISRFENLPGARALLRVARHGRPPLPQLPPGAAPHRAGRRASGSPGIEDAFDAVHGGQRLRLFNAHHDGCGFQPIMASNGEGRMAAAVLPCVFR